MENIIITDGGELREESACRQCGKFIVSPVNGQTMCSTCTTIVGLEETNAELTARVDQLRGLLADVIRCMPGHSGCGDFSREQRVRAACVQEFGEPLSWGNGAQKPRWWLFWK
jgi:hypothetical protein